MVISAGSEDSDEGGFWSGRGRSGGVSSGLSGGERSALAQDCAALLRQAVKSDNVEEVKRLLAGGSDAGWLMGGAQGALMMAATCGSARCAQELATGLLKKESGLVFIKKAIEEAVIHSQGVTFEALASLVQAESNDVIAIAARAKTSEMLALVLKWTKRALTVSEVSELLWTWAGEARVEGIKMALALPGSDPWVVSGSGQLAIEALARNVWKESSCDCAELLAEAMSHSAAPARMAAVAARMEGVMQGLSSQRWAHNSGPLCFRAISDRWIEVSEISDASKSGGKTKGTLRRAL